MKLVLLPGLDGTGKLFAPLIEALPSSIDVQVITYPLNKKQSYNELVKYVKQNLPKEDFVLLAESFSGPIAYQVALSKPKELKSLILVATFLENPRPFLLKFIPSSKVLGLPIPTILSRVFFLGFSVKTKVIELFNEAIKTVSPSVIQYRLKEITQLKPSSQRVKLKTTYIQASNDKLVPSKSLKDWQKVCDDIDVFKVEGEHFILQANSVRCAEVITETVRLITSSRSQ
jgi:pimeloyl-[acyl-carrier protein] methyl ester esterase